MKTKIVVATHKEYAMPEDRELYLPVFVGKTLHPDVDLGFQGDNSGENISNKNASYNELTALYWAWKNLDCEALGLVHYRRYFSLVHSKSLKNVITENDVNSILKEFDVILPQKRHYYIESNYSHYVHAHPKEELEITRKILVNYFPDYVESFDIVMKKTSAHMFNMFIMKRSVLNKYCTWLFDILEKVENELDVSNYDSYQSRVYGFISERLLDVWILKNSINYTEVNLLYTESQHWPSKILNFLKRKFTSKKR